MLTPNSFIRILGAFFISMGLSACGSPEELQNTLKSFARQEGESVNTPRSSCIASTELSPISRPVIPDMDKWFPVKLPQTHSPDDCPASKVQIVELRGWLGPWTGRCSYEDTGWKSFLILDTEWAVSKGFNLNKLIKMGNINPTVPNSNWREREDLPRVITEIYGWKESTHFTLGPSKGARGQRQHILRPLPEGWKLEWGCRDMAFPYNPLNPIGDPDTGVTEGQYVRMVGSLVTDNPHDGEAEIPEFFCQTFNLCFGDQEAERNAVLQAWSGGAAENNEGNVARWTEIHPPDFIVPLNEPTSKDIIATAIALFSDHCLFDPCTVSERHIEYELSRLPSDSSSEIEVIEDVSHEPGEAPNVGTIILGNNDGDAAHNTGAKITIEPLGGGGTVRVHIDVGVRGEGGLGRPGKFKAIYRLRWKAQS